MHYNSDLEIKWIALKKPQPYAQKLKQQLN